MLDNRFKRGLKNFNSSNKTSKQVKNYLGKKADILGISLPKYISSMKNVSASKVNRFINRLINQADKEIKKTEIAKIQQEASVNKLKNAIKVYNNKVEKIIEDMHKKYTKTEVEFLEGKPLRILGEDIYFDGSKGFILEKIDINNFEFSSKDNMDNFTKDLINSTKNLSFKKYDEQLLDTDTVNGLTSFYEEKLNNFLDEFNELQYSDDFNKLSDRYNRLNKVQKNMFVQAYKNNIRDEYLKSGSANGDLTDKTSQEMLERNYLNKLLRIMNDVEEK